MKKSKFLHFLAVHNGLDDLGFQNWIFEPGMRFGALEKWWDGSSAEKRSHPHEGVDFRCYVAQGKELFVGETTMVPLMYGGCVERVFADFLGQSILVSHQRQAGRILYTMYGHTRPDDDLSGREFSAGEVIASVAGQKNSKVPPHLHVSLFWVPEDMSPATIDWLVLGSPAVSLCDPLLSMAPYPPWRVYIVRCSDNTLYTGITTDVLRRTREHNSTKGGAKYTRARQPVQLVYHEPAQSRSAAAAREYCIKQMNLIQKKELIKAA